jgi:hypothetical protein
MARMGFTKASSFVVRVGHVPMEPAARLATSHANCAAADRGEPTPADRAAPGRTHANSAATLALRLARARDAGLGDDAAAASLGTHEERDCCFRVARLVRREATMAATRSLAWPLRSLARPVQDEFSAVVRENRWLIICSRASASSRGATGPRGSFARSGCTPVSRAR